MRITAAEFKKIEGRWNKKIYHENVVYKNNTKYEIEDPKNLVEKKPPFIFSMEKTKKIVEGMKDGDTVRILPHKVILMKDFGFYSLAILEALDPKLEDKIMHEIIYAPEDDTLDFDEEMVLGKIQKIADLFKEEKMI